MSIRLSCTIFALVTSTVFDRLVRSIDHIRWYDRRVILWDVLRIDPTLWQQTQQIANCIWIESWHVLYIYRYIYTYTEEIWALYAATKFDHGKWTFPCEILTCISKCMCLVPIRAYNHCRSHTHLYRMGQIPRPMHLQEISYERTNAFGRVNGNET